MRVLLASLRWDYKDPARGDSFEYVNLWDALSRTPGIEATFFGVDEQERKLGRDSMNRALLARVDEWRPDLVFFFLFKDEIEPATVERLTARNDLVTLNWFADDHWRFADFSRHWAPRFDWVATTDARALPRYRAIGVQRAIHSQWACNHHVYRPLPVERDIDVSFVGQPYGGRREFVERLRGEGLRVEAYGQGWESGRLPLEGMIEVFSRSRVNLNFAASSLHFGARYAAAQILRRRGPLVVPRPLQEMRWNAALLRDATRPQVKARNFEVCGSRTFLLTERVGELSRYYEDGSELATFRGYRELRRQIARHLADDAGRERIAVAAYERTLREHTYEIRFRDLFARIGLGVHG